MVLFLVVVSVCCCFCPLSFVENRAGLHAAHVVSLQPLFYAPNLVRPFLLV